MNGSDYGVNRTSACRLTVDDLIRQLPGTLMQIRSVGMPMRRGEPVAT
jgi:hypothetical protein